MRTYKKKSLRAEVLNAEKYGNSGSEYLGANIAEFINKGNYSRIADIIIIPSCANCNLHAVIIYEMFMKETDR